MYIHRMNPYGKRSIHLGRRFPSRHKSLRASPFPTRVSRLDRICWTCSLCFDTAEELAEHRQLPEFKHVHDRNYINGFLGSANSYNCHWCRTGFPSAIGRYNHEAVDLIHWENTVRGYRCEGMVAMRCSRCDELVSTSCWSDHERFSWGHNCCYACQLDFPHLDSLKEHIEKFSSDGRHEWVCQKNDCRVVCCNEADLENHCYAWMEHRGGYCGEHASFQCEYCKRILGTLPLWQEHMSVAHLGVLNGYEISDEGEYNDSHAEESSWQWHSVTMHRLASCEIT